MSWGCKVHCLVNPWLMIFIKIKLLCKLFITVDITGLLSAHMGASTAKYLYWIVSQLLIVSSNKTASPCINELPQHIYHSYSCSSTTADRGCGMWFICYCFYTIYIGWKEKSSWCFLFPVKCEKPCLEVFENENLEIFP